MPKLSTAVVATSRTEVKIAPAVKKQLLTKLKTYADLKRQRDALDAAMKTNRVDVEEIMEKVGETTLEVEGFKTTLIAPVKKKLDVKRLVALGVSTDIIKRATTETPGTPYVKITAPGSKAESEEDE